MTSRTATRASARIGAWAATAALLMASVMTASAASAAPAVELEPGDSVHIGSKQGYGGTGAFPVWPGDAAAGEPLYWAYCLENQVSAKTGVTGYVGDLDAFVGVNYFSDPAVQAKVLWVLAHSYPAVSLEEFGAAIGVPDISRNDALEATQYAIWRYTDVGGDTEWPFENEDSRTAFWYLVDGANASAGLTPEDLVVTASVEAPTAPQTADSLIGPFTVSTNQSTVSATTDPDVAITDAAGNPIDADAVVDGQELYLDLRGSTAAGSATVSVSARGSSSTGKIISVPTTPGGTATTADHAQTLILVTPSDTLTTGQATVDWAALPVPGIGTSLVDSADGDRVLPWNGGTVVDTVAYENLVPGAQYTVTGELMLKADGSATGITGSTTFTPTTASGSVDVSFVVPEGYAGDVLVAFERLFIGTDVSGEPIAVHEDIEDAAQTVTVEEEPTGPTNPTNPTEPTNPSTPTEPTNPTEPEAQPASNGGQLASTGGGASGLIGGIAGALLLAGAALFLIRRPGMQR